MIKTLVLSENDPGNKKGQPLELITEEVKEIEAFGQKMF